MLSQGWLWVESASAMKICLNTKQVSLLPPILQECPLLRPLTYHHVCHVSHIWAASKEEVAKLLSAVYQTGDAIPPP